MGDFKKEDIRGIARGFSHVCVDCIKDEDWRLIEQGRIISQEAFDEKTRDLSLEDAVDIGQDTFLTVQYLEWRGGHLYCAQCNKDLLTGKPAPVAKIIIERDSGGNLSARIKGLSGEFEWFVSEEFCNFLKEELLSLKGDEVPEIIEEALIMLKGDD